MLLFAAPACWSTNYLIARWANGVIGPHLLALGRWALAGALMLPFVWHALRHDRTLLRREGRHLLVLGALGMWICGAWVYLAGHTTTSTNIALIYAVTPVSIAVLSAHLLHERMTRSQQAGIVFALLGVVFVIAKGDLGNLRDVRFTAGDGWILAAAAAWTAYSVLLRHWPSTLGPLERLVATIGGGVVVLVPFAVIEWWVWPQPAPGVQALGLVVLAAVVPGIASYGAYSFLQREIGAARTALMLYLSPIYAALAGWLVLGEVPQWYHALGAALILPSIWFATRR